VANHLLVRLFQKAPNLENPLLLDDSLFWGSLHLFQEAGDSEIKTIGARVVSQTFYPMHDIWVHTDDIAADHPNLRALNAGRRMRANNDVCEKVPLDLSN
jgi:uncharacterized protein